METTLAQKLETCRKILGLEGIVVVGVLNNRQSLFTGATGCVTTHHDKVGLLTVALANEQTIFQKTFLDHLKKQEQK